MTKFLPFLFDSSRFFTNQKCFIVVGEKIAFLTAFLNSSLFKYCFREYFPELQGGTRELSKIFFENIPVFNVDLHTNNLFLEKVNSIQKQKRKQIDTHKLEVDVDHMIFDIYKLSDRERETIGFIEIQ